MRVAYLAENLGRIDQAWSKDAAGLMHDSGHNIGNLAFWYAARLLLEAEPVIVTRSTLARDVPDDVRAFVIPAANFLNATADLTPLAELVRQLDRPCLVLGLGAQAEAEEQPPALKPGTVAFLKEVSARASNIGVRGPFSAAVCQANGVGNTTILGCPSIFINPTPDLGQRIAGRIARLEPEGPLAIHAACIKSVVQSVERELVHLVRLNPGSCYVVQRPVELIKAAFGEAMLQADAAGLKLAASFLGFDGGVERLTAFLRAYILVPDSVDGWVHHLRRFVAGVNTRIHGTLMSVAAEIPGLCVWHDTRTRELAQELGLPHLSVRQFTENRHSVRDMFAASGFDGPGFDARRRDLAGLHIRLISDAGLIPSAHLRRFHDC